MLIVYGTSLKAQTFTGKIALDEYVSAGLPGKVTTTDTIVDNFHVVQKYAVIGNGAYFITKMRIGESNEELNELPYDEKSLYTTYRGGAKGFVKGMQKRGFAILDTSKISIGKFKGYLLTTKANGEKTGEAKMIVLGDYLYMVIYVNVVDYDELKSREFLSTMTVNQNSPGQMEGKSPSSKLAYMLGKILASALTLIILVVLSRKVRKIEKNKFPNHV
jgi:hypothetical protein